MKEQQRDKGRLSSRRNTLSLKTPPFAKIQWARPRFLSLKFSFVFKFQVYLKIYTMIRHLRSYIICSFSVFSSFPWVCRFSRLTNLWQSTAVMNTLTFKLYGALLSVALPHIFYFLIVYKLQKCWCFSDWGQDRVYEEWGQLE